MSLMASSFPSCRPADLSRLPVVALFCAGALLMGLALAPRAAQPLAQGQPAPAAAQAPAAAEPLLREGTELVDQVGQFKLSGQRVIFILADGKRQLEGLENLSLERIAKEISGNPDPRTWLVTGTVTEFQGSNYLLVRRAIQKSR